MYEIRLSVRGFADSDERERAELTRDLGAALESRRLGSTRHPRASAPAGAKGPALDWAQLLLGFAGNLPALLGFLRSWQHDHHGASIEIEIDGDRLMLENPSEQERREVVDAWLQRHGRGG